MAIAPDLRVDNAALFGLMQEHYPMVTAQTAVAAFRGIQRFHREYEREHDNIPPDSVTKKWKPQLDGLAADAMSYWLHRIPLLTVKVGSEGDKEADSAKDGMAAPSVKGAHGMDHFPVVWGVSDVIEGTTPGSKNRPGASSVLAVSTEGGLMPTPDGVHYMMKLIAPVTPAEAAQNNISLDTPHEENLERICHVLNISPNELLQVTMNRTVNRPFIDAAKRMGVEVDPIEVGDFMPGVSAAIDVRKFGEYRPTILVGRGGVEEGTASAVAARTLGTFMEARAQFKDDTVMSDTPIWTLDGHLVPGAPEASLLVVSFITDDEKTFGRVGVRETCRDSYRVGTMTVSHQGINFRQVLIHS